MTDDVIAATGGLTTERIQAALSIDPDTMTLDQLAEFLMLTSVTIQAGLQRTAELEAQLAAVGVYARYYAAADAAYMAVGKPRVLSFEDWWQTPHCPQCGNVQLDRGPGPDGADLWECAGRDGCGYNWPVEPPQT